MIYYLLLLSKHKSLSLRRNLDYKRNLIITVTLISFLILSLISLFIALSKEDIEIFSVFLVPSILTLDFSLRFFFKKNTSAAIFPYLTLPIPRKALISYIILSDLPDFWVWGCLLIYGIILYYCGILTFLTAITLLLFILFNNYLVAFVKALIGGYAILTYPFCLGFVCVLLLIAKFLNPVITILIIAIGVVSLATAIFLTLNENLHNELNRIAL